MSKVWKKLTGYDEFTKSDKVQVVSALIIGVGLVGAIFWICKTIGV